MIFKDFHINWPVVGRLGRGQAWVLGNEKVYLTNRSKGGSIDSDWVKGQKAGSKDLLLKIDPDIH